MARGEARPLNGKVIAITGAARGIGLATARACAARGMKVAIGDLDLAEAQRAAESVPGAIAPAERSRAHPRWTSALVRRRRHACNLVSATGAG